MKLNIQLVPQTCFYKNVRQILMPEQWKIICSQVYSTYYYQCAICDGVGEKHPVEGHEVWDYDDKNCIQILREILALCPMCHLTVHFGFAQTQGRGTHALKHFMKINKLSKKKALIAIAAAFAVWQIRSAKKWTLDLSVLEDYGIDVSNLEAQHE